MMKPFYTTIIILVSFGLVCCKDKVQKNQNQRFTYDVPSDGMGKGSLFESIKLIRDSLKLDTLENGYDSLQIRIWLGYSFTYKQQLIILKNHKGNWNAYYFEIKPHYYERTDSLISFEKYVAKKNPKMLWQDFIKTLYSYKILTLPDYSRIKGYKAPALHGNGIVIEVSDMHSYRLYSYPLPKLAQEFSEAKNIENILNLLTQEFDIKLLGSI